MNTQAPSHVAGCENRSEIDEFCLSALRRQARRRQPSADATPSEEHAASGDPRPIAVESVCRVKI
jgi:hypothetical protein